MSDSSAKTAAVRYELVAEAVQDPQTTDPIVVVRKALRGRIKRALILAILFGVTGAILGYLAVPPVYQSSGLVRISSSLPAVLYEETNAQFSEPFEVFAENQATQLVSREVLHAATRNAQLQQLGWQTGDHGVQQLQNALGVSRERGHQFMHVTFEHTDPEIAQAAINAVLIAYAEQYGAQKSLSPADVEQVLTQREQEMTKQLQALRSQMLTSSDQYGLEAIERLHTEKVEQLTTIDQKLAELNRAITAVSESLDAAPDKADPQAVQDAMTAFVTGGVESSSSLMQREHTLIAEIESWKKRYGPNHPMLREFNRQLEVVRVRLQMASAPQALTLGVDSDAPNTAQTLLNHLLNLEQTYYNMRDSVLAEAAEIGNRKAILAGIQEHITEVKQRLADTRMRLDAIQVENSRPASSRVSIAATGDFPLSPIKDRRRGLAAAAGLFGMLLGTAVVVFVGLIDQRCHYVDQLAQCATGAPILCRLPDLTSNDDGDIARSTIAVHQLRHSLQISHEDTPGKVITITSCSPGEGKTSLALALASSFAGSGSRTLLIDADPRSGTITHQMQLDHLPGLYDAVRGGQNSGEIVRTESENLWVLPIGALNNGPPAQLSQQNFRWLLNAVADRFDAVIIDTGPVTTSVEASASCAVADFVLLMVARDQASSLVRDAVDRAQHCSAGRIGLVYNRAHSKDVRFVDDAPAPMSRDITALVPGSIPQSGSTAGQIGSPVHINAESAHYQSRAA